MKVLLVRGQSQPDEIKTEGSTLINEMCKCLHGRSICASLTVCDGFSVHYTCSIHSNGILCTAVMQQL